MVVITYAPPSYRPDGMIKRATSTETFVGNNIYNTTGANQTRGWSAARGRTREFSVKFGNDGNVGDSYVIKGCGSSAGFTVKYFRGATGITQAVTSGTYRTAQLSAGATTTITLRIHVTSTATMGATKGCVVRAVSGAQNTRVDAAKATLKVVS
jgi:uncharacterized membrane protein